MRFFTHYRRALLKPQDSVIMRIRSDYIVAPVTVHVRHIHKAERGSSESRMKGPLGIRTRRRLEPAFGSKDIVAAILVHISGANAVSMAVGVDNMFTICPFFASYQASGVFLSPNWGRSSRAFPSLSRSTRNANSMGDEFSMECSTHDLPFWPGF